MNLKRTCHWALLSTCIALAASAQAQTTSTPAPAPAAAPATAPDPGATKDSIDADHKAAIAACKRLGGNAKDICEAEADGKRKVALAELKQRRSGRPADQVDVSIAKAEAAYAVAKERCDDLSGDAKDACRKDAKATEARAKADAKAHKS